MRPRIEWMTQADERVLEFLHEKDIIASPSVIAANIDYSNEYISRRCQQLAEEGFIQRTDPSNYQITDLGEKFLTGELVEEEEDEA
nr:MarR family transcriptional regulator [Haloglomus salinum]